MPSDRRSLLPDAVPLPESANTTHSTRYRVGGLLCRMAVICAAVAGMTSFLSDSLRLGIPHIYLILCAVFAVCWVSLFFLGRKTALIGGGVAVVAVAVCVCLAWDHIADLRFIPFALWNSCLLRFRQDGFLTSLSPAAYDATLSDELLVCIAMTLVTLLIAFLYTACLLRRVNLVPAAAVSTVLLVVLLTFNLYADDASNLGAALMMVALAAVLVMAASDRFLQGDRQGKVRGEASSGYTAVAALLIFSLIMAVPAACVEGRFPAIQPVDKYLSAARDYMTALLQGDDDALDDVSHRLNDDTSRPRPTDAEHLSFTGRRMMFLHTNENINYYLTGWVGVDYRDGAWQPADDETLKTYRGLFGTDQSPAETLRASFYSHEMHLRQDTYYPDNRHIGYVISRVAIRKLTDTDDICYLPTVYSPAEGLMTFEQPSFWSGSEPAIRPENPLSFINYYDGIRVGRDFGEKGASYAVYAYAPIMTDPNWAIRLSDAYSNWMTSQNRPVLSDVYGDFVRNTYTTPGGSPLLTELAASLFDPDLIRAEEHPRQRLILQDAVTRSLINYVIQDLGCRYTLTPDLSRVDSSLDGVENFLFNTKEGYCVQFASAVALLLREYGIPTRYVEGYIGTDLEPAEDGNGYEGYVRDYHAHAWVEVYFDGIGWIPYETTPLYYDAMYAATGSPDVSTDPVTPDTDPATEPPTALPETDTPTEPPTEPDSLPITDSETTPAAAGAMSPVHVLIPLGLLLLAVAVCLYLRRARRLGMRRLVVATSVIADGVPPERQRKTARELNRAIRGLLARYGLAPRTGELPAAYAERLNAHLTRHDLSEDGERILSSLPALFDAMSAEEFGHGMTAEELCGVAELYVFLYGERKRFLSLLKRLCLRLFTHEL